MEKNDIRTVSYTHLIERQLQKLADTKKANEEASYKAEPIKPEVSFLDFFTFSQFRM